ncbi:SDR family NAD(P)-dependent oxidoreductase [Oryzibacter oryziterrae]|uniref:SDR family NAD(P)-dependent oxidoreductase n=1 Tax=Oryzibacter oryziterrae TaxID=2766474 RepID=UPI001F45979D|nr:SDR family NAD(P)-dependent oxidoreductase [Oryzibacter oryziterrae]
MSSVSSDPRVLLVTGASTGIGYASARDFAARGWKVFATVRTEADRVKLEAIPGVTATILDYGRPETIAATLEEVLAKGGGRIDALFNNGAYGQPGAVEDLTVDVLRQQFDSIVFGWHDLTRRVIPIMRRQGHGRIVQCSSILGFVSMPYRGAYNAAKHAVEGLTDTLRLELRGTGIEVISIQPGPIATQFVKTSMKKFHENIDIEASAFREVYRQRLNRMGRGGASAFKLPPEAVVKCLIHACESARPKPYYRVTLQTKFMAVVKRLLPARAFIAFSAWAASRET